MIILKLNGGLGNQMFQYAFARYLQELYGEPIRICTVGYNKDTSGREYSLQNFQLEDIIVPPRYVQWMDAIVLKLKTILYTRNSEDMLHGENNFQILSGKGLYVTNDLFNYYKIVKCNKKNKYISGFYQSEKFFYPVKEKIKTYFKINVEPSKANKQLIKELKSCNSVCVHIRRGDYVNTGWTPYLSVCNEEYYKSAMDVVASKTKDPIFYVFSNSSEDIQWIKENYHFKYNVRYVDLNNPDYEEIRLMYSCHHFILSNSSFSWWASYLTKSKDKIVVAPGKWHNMLEAKDIYQDDWIVIKKGLDK